MLVENILIYQFLNTLFLQDTLDLSHNFLTEISTSLENFWSSTLQYVDLSYNQLTEISDSIVSLCKFQTSYTLSVVFFHLKNIL